MMCITNVSYSTVTYLKTHVRSDQSDRKINLSILSQIDPIPKIIKLFSIQSRELESMGHLGLEQVNFLLPAYFLILE